MSRRNILVSTSNGFNPGDDFIREGVLSLIEDKDAHNYFYWNRSLNTGSSYENDLEYNLQYADYILMAGTPQWLLRNERIYEYAIERRLPVSLIGVGNSNKHSDWGHLEPLLREISSSGIINLATTRDRSAHDRLAEYSIPSIILPCPASLSAQKHIQRKGPPKVIALSLTGVQVQSFDRNDIHTYLLCKFYEWLYRACKERFPEARFVFLAHSTVDIHTSSFLFPGMEVLYSYNYRDVFKWYENIDLYIGNRVHGSILALSHCTPTLFLGRDERADTLEPFESVAGGALRRFRIGQDTLRNLSTIKNGIRAWLNTVNRRYSDLNESFVSYHESLQQLYSETRRILNERLNGGG